MFEFFLNVRVSFLAGRVAFLACFAGVMQQIELFNLSINWQFFAGNLLSVLMIAGERKKFENWMNQLFIQRSAITRTVVPSVLSLCCIRFSLSISLVSWCIFVKSVCLPVKIPFVEHQITSLYVNITTSLIDPI